MYDDHYLVASFNGQSQHGEGSGEPDETYEDPASHHQPVPAQGGRRDALPCRGKEIRAQIREQIRGVKPSHISQTDGKPPGYLI